MTQPLPPQTQLSATNKPFALENSRVSASRGQVGLNARYPQASPEIGAAPARPAKKPAAERLALLANDIRLEIEGSEQSIQKYFDNRDDTSHLERQTELRETIATLRHELVRAEQQLDSVLAEGSPFDQLAAEVISNAQTVQGLAGAAYDALVDNRLRKAYDSEIREQFDPAVVKAQGVRFIDIRALATRGANRLYNQAEAAKQSGVEVPEKDVIAAAESTIAELQKILTVVEKEIK